MRSSSLSPAALLLFAGVALLPVYVFESGSAQPTHMALAAFSVIVLAQYGVQMSGWVAVLLALALHGTFVEGAYTLGGADPAGMINAAFLWFNLLVPYAVYQFVAREGESMIARGLIISCLIAVATVLISGVQLQGDVVEGRSTGSFNNPNQLGYFAVCLLSLTYLLYTRKQLGNMTALALFAASTFLSVASLSKAAIVANIAVIFFVVRPMLTKRSTIRWLALMAVGVGGIFYALASGMLDQYFFLQRLTGMFDEGDSSLASRGYLIFLEGDVLQTLLGLGQENVLDLLRHEVHSTFFAVLSNYGLVGLVLFLWAMGIWAVTVYREHGLIGLLCITGPSMAYGITHNGTRFTIFWILFAVSLASPAVQAAFRDRSGTASSPPPLRTFGSPRLGRTA
jgi:hypothetical protein